MSEVFFYNPNLMTDVWKLNPYKQGEWYKITMNNVGLITCRVTKNVKESDKLDSTNNNCYFMIGDFIYDARHMDQIKDFMKGYER